MIARRELMALGAAALILPRFARAADAPPLSYKGQPLQGRLMVCMAARGASVTVDGAAVQATADGMFAFGIAYDRVKAIEIAIRSVDGAIATTQILPIARQYEIQHVNGLPQKFVTPPPEELERIHRENLIITDARKRDSDGMGFAQEFLWPFPGILSGVYGSQRIDNGTPMAPHLGVDIAAPEGTPIHAPADAIVSIADDYFLDGGFTLLDHGHGVSSCYLHQSKRFVKAGDVVVRGQVIGHVGHTGRATGPHSHWGLNWFQLKLDPSLSTPTPLPPRT